MESNDNKTNLVDDFIENRRKSSIVDESIINSFVESNDLSEDDVYYLNNKLAENNIEVIHEEKTEAKSVRKISSSSDSLNMYFSEISNYPLLTSSEEISLAKMIKEGDEEALNKLVNSNLRLVASVAKKYKDQGLSYLDLIQEGNLGLMKAAKKFDPSKGCRFSTYAIFWIKQSLSRSIASKGRTISIPIYIAEGINKVKAYSNRLTGILDREPTPKEISEASGGEFDEDKVKQLLSYDSPLISLDKPLREDDKNNLSDIISSDSDDDIDLLNYKIEDIEKAVNELPERERKLIVLRYGLFNNSTHTLEELGKINNFTRERARQLVNRGIKMLAKTLAVSGDSDERDN